jgi:hypothetical protein
MTKKRILNCCNTRKKKCIRKDGKIFSLPRRFTRKKCKKGPIKGFSMRSSCAPYKFCKTKKQFLYNPDNPKKSFDVYVDKYPRDTINIKYKTLNDVKFTIKKLEKLYKSKKYSHKRIWQVAMIMKVRLDVIKKKSNTKDIHKRVSLAKKYYNFLKKRTKLKEDKRFSLVFTYK